jgi:hypothetical protein
VCRPAGLLRGNSNLTHPPAWLKNRDPAHWRDAWQVEHTFGKYIMSDKPMTEEQWALERADVIDVTPENERDTDATRKG